MLLVRPTDLNPMTYGILRPAFRELAEMFDDASTLARHDTSRTEFSPAYEVDETSEHYVVSFDVPGVRKEDLNIELTGNRLVVSGERQPELQSPRRRYGKFEHSFSLPEGVTPESIVAEHKDGVLRLAIQKPNAAKPTTIRISDGSSQQRGTGFFKSLIGEKRTSDSADAKKAESKTVTVTAAN